jgi:acyl-CoA reductase-like NAD-dependent aldehyde dehydrogenase
LPRASAGATERIARICGPELIGGPPFNTTITKLPAGVVTIIYPFNWPLAILAASLPYALIAGNTVIAKPPPTTPLSSVLTLRHLVANLPPGVLNVVTGADDVAGLCEEARHAGAEVLTFGEYTAGVTGNYLLPSLVLDPAADLKIVTEEQFGPALPVIPYDDEAEAVALANNTWSGLCSSVWSADTEHAMKIGRQLRTGVTFFNNHNATAVDERAPFGGFNQSGIGRELGREGLLCRQDPGPQRLDRGAHRAGPGGGRGRCGRRGRRGAATSDQPGPSTAGAGRCTG